jgi:hypothetical protein
MFASPNIASIMNSVPPEHRGAASGMRATLQNSGQTVSLAIFFTIIITGLSNTLPGTLSKAMVAAGVPQLAATFSSIPPTSALFAAFLGFNPVQSILSLPQLASVVKLIPQSTLIFLTGQTFFPNAIAPAFVSALDLSYYIGAALSVAAAVSSLLRGRKYIHGMNEEPQKVPVPQPSLKSRQMRGNATVRENPVEFEKKR